MSNYAIYQPKNKAQEYALYACNFFVGCSNGCTYCFLKKGIGKATLGGDKPTLKKCFRSESHALDVFESEMLLNMDDLRKHGLFFSFTTDPMLPDTIDLTFNAAGIAVRYGVPVKILTKCADWVDEFIEYLDKSNAEKEWRKDYAFGFTLTGHDKLEKGASTNAERIEAMRKLHDVGFKTFASIEPIIDLNDSLRMIYRSCDCCDLYKIGLESGRNYVKEDLIKFIQNVYVIRENYNGRLQSGDEIKIYFKDSLLKQAGIKREDLPDNCVVRDYNMFCE